MAPDSPSHDDKNTPIEHTASQLDGPNDNSGDKSAKENCVCVPAGSESGTLRMPEQGHSDYPTAEEYDDLDENDTPPPLVTPVSEGAEMGLGALRISPEIRQAWAGESPAGNKIFLWFFLCLLVFSLYLTYILFSPFLSTIIVALIFSAICYPLYSKIYRLYRGRKVLAALTVLILVMFLVLIPITIFLVGFIPQASQSMASINKWLQLTDISDSLNVHLEPLHEWLLVHFPELDLSALDIKQHIVNFSSQAGQYLLSSGTTLLGNTVTFIAHLMLAFLIMFFALIDGHAWLYRIEYLLPMKPEQTMVVVDSLRRMARAVLVGGFCVAALQGIAGGIGLAVVGISPLFWGTAMAFAALVPVLGTGLVWVPAVAYLFFSGQIKEAVFLSLWCGVGVTSIDSILRPILMRGGAHVSVLFIFLSIIGGIATFGMLGLLYGPLILGLAVVMLEIYNQEYKTILDRRAMMKKNER